MAESIQTFEELQKRDFFKMADQSQTETEAEPTPAVVQFPIVDSHIHLWPSSEIPQLSWCSPDHPLGSQYSVDEYTAATAPPPSRVLEGFIYLETDRTHDLHASPPESGWEFPLQEVEWLKRIALGTPKDGEGHSLEQKDLCLALIPWAPLPLGAKLLEEYVEKVKERAGESFEKIRGFRYLLQDKAPGTMLKEDFIEGLKWLGRNNLVFDVGVDQRSGGNWQLEEAVEMIGETHQGVPLEEKTTFIINHLCKPNFTILETPGVDVQNEESFITWRSNMYYLSKCSNTYMKLSGCFSEIPSALQAASAEEIFDAIQPWFVVLLTTFGTKRLMFGSDWPVCTVGIGEGAWKKWKAVVERFCVAAGLDMEDKIMLWSGTAISAYGIKMLM